jgi:hypothetical protein
MLKSFQTNAKEWRTEKVARVVERRFQRQSAAGPPKKLKESWA